MQVFTQPSGDGSLDCRLVLALSQRSMLQAFSASLAMQEGIQVVGEASTATEGVDLIRSRAACVVLADPELPDRGVLALADETSVRLGKAKLALLLKDPSDSLLEQMIRLRAGGWLLQNQPLGEIVQSLKDIQQGSRVIAPALQPRIEVDHTTDRAQVIRRTTLARLTDRQLEVLRHLAEGHSVKEVARTLHVSEKSVESQKYRIMNRLNIHDRVKLALYAVSEGLIPSNIKHG